MSRTILCLSLCALQVGATMAVPSFPPPFGGGTAAAAQRGRADTSQAAPPQFLPWPPPVPAPAPTGTPPFLPSADPFGPNAPAANLEQVLAAVQSGMDRLWRWLESLRQAAAAALAQIVRPLPIGVPGGIGPADIVAQIAALPEGWRAIINGALAKLQAPRFADAPTARHEADIAESPELTHEADAIASADQQVLASVTQQEVAIATTAAVAAAAAQDTALPAAAAAAQATADRLIAGAQDLPSSRAGIELLVAGTGAGMRHQTALTVALADRITAIVQQTAQLSGQVGALVSTIGVMTERDLERDRDGLNARLGIADLARGGRTMLRQLLEDAGEPADEIRLVPLY